MGWIEIFKRKKRKTADQRQSISYLGNLMPGVYYRTAFEPELRLTDIGENITDLLGYSSKELLNKSALSYLAFIHPEHDEMIAIKKAQCSKSREVKTLQYNMFTKSGEARLVEDHYIGEYDQAENLVAINGYLKEFRRASVKSKLQNQLEAYRAAMDVHMISSITDPRGCIIYANENFKKISQYTDEELLGNTHRIVCSDYHPKSFFEEMWRTISSGKMWSGDILNRAKDGSLYWVATVIIPIFGKQDKISSFLSLRMLITERKQAEAQQEKYMRVLEDIAHVVAHDIRGPICSIIGLVNLLERTGCPKEELQRGMDYLTYATKKLDEMTRELSLKIYTADQDLKIKQAQSILPQPAEPKQNGHHALLPVMMDQRQGNGH